MSRILDTSTQIARISLNILIVLLCLALGVEVGTRLWHTPNGHHDELAIGKRIPWIVDDHQTRRTVLFALRTTCKFCAASIPFYKRVLRTANRQAGIRLIAVTDSSNEDIRKYLQSKAVTFSAVKHDSFDALGIEGTPTILIVDDHGIVQHSWIGLLNKDAEADATNEMFGQGLDAWHSPFYWHNLTYVFRE